MQKKHVRMIKKHTPKQHTCRYCHTRMSKGIAMQSTLTGIPDFPGGDVMTLSPGGSGKLIVVQKCKQCGWCVT